MTDLEMTKLCAEAMGYEDILSGPAPGYSDVKIVSFSSQFSSIHFHGRAGFPYNPLHDDAQAMALVKKLGVEIGWTGYAHSMDWTVEVNGVEIVNKNLNRAIVECVAKMQKDKNDR